jgi:hypothetical protein
MAQGTLVIFDEFSYYLAQGYHPMTGGLAAVYKMALITTLPTFAQASPQLGDFTEVSGSNYTAGGETLAVAFNYATGLTTVRFTDTAPTAEWLEHASGPTNIKAGIIYNSTVTEKFAMGFVDFTEDGGTTAISLANGDITWDVTSTIDSIMTIAVN